MSYDDVDLLSKPKNDLGNVINKAQTSLKPTKGLRRLMNIMNSVKPNPRLRRPMKRQRPKKYKSNPRSNRLFWGGDDQWDKHLDGYYDSETEAPSASSSVTPIPHIDDLDEGYQDAF